MSWRALSPRAAIVSVVSQSRHTVATNSPGRSAKPGADNPCPTLSRIIISVPVPYFSM